jgi:hypothetical protein
MLSDRDVLLICHNENAKLLSVTARGFAGLRWSPAGLGSSCRVSRRRGGQAACGCHGTKSHANPRHNARTAPTRLGLQTAKAAATTKGTARLSRLLLGAGRPHVVRPPPERTNVGIGSGSGPRPPTLVVISSFGSRRSPLFVTGYGRPGRLLPRPLCIRQSSRSPPLTRSLSPRSPCLPPSLPTSPPQCRCALQPLRRQRATEPRRSFRCCCRRLWCP